MITTLAFGLLLSSLQNGAPVATALGRPVTREPNLVVLVHRGPATRFEVPAIWTEQEKIDLTEVAADSAFVGRKSAATSVQHNEVTVSPSDFQAALTGIPALETPAETRLPSDGRLMLVWNRATGLIDVQMAAATVVVAEGESLSCPQIGDRDVGMVTSAACKAQAQQVNGKFVVTQLSPEADPTTRLTSYSGLTPANLEELFENRPTQVALGYFDLQATGERVNDRPQYRCALSTWLEEPGQRDLCVAKSSDDLNWYIWFEGQMPE